MKAALTFLGATLIIGAILVSAIWWPLYKYHDCKRVGHSTLYCVMDIGH